MLASRADSFLSGSIEEFQQPDKPPTSGSHGPRSLSSYRNKQQEAVRPLRGETRGGDDEDTGVCSAPALCGGGIYVSPDPG